MPGVEGGAGRPAAIVTGASRGIGKAVAIALAADGYDVAITARSVRDADRTPDPDGLVEGALPGSLEETAAAVEAVGGRAHAIGLDLLDRSRLAPAMEEAMAALGRVDLLVNNAIAVGPGGHGRFLDDDPDDVADRIFGNVTAQLLLMRPVVARMVAQGRGVVLNMTSAAGYLKPFAPAGAGGWSLAYSASKGGFHRIAPQLAYEYGRDGLVALNVQPGFVATERAVLAGGPLAAIAERGVAPEVIGRAVAHVARHAAGYDPQRTVQLQDVARELGLLDVDPAEAGGGST